MPINAPVKGDCLVNPLAIISEMNEDTHTQ